MGSGGLKKSPQTTPGRLRTARELFLWLLGRRTRHRVVNMSMEPAVSPGDFLLVNPRAYQHAMPAQGDLIVARHPTQPDQIITKRVGGVGKEGIELLSDNPRAGQDSRHFGPVALPLIHGQVTCVIR